MLAFPFSASLFGQPFRMDRKDFRVGGLIAFGNILCIASKNLLPFISLDELGEYM